MGGLDWAVIGAYFLSLVGLTWYSVRKNRDTPDDYFLAGRNLGWFIVAASIFSSNIGSEHLVGLAGSGCTIYFQYYSVFICLVCVCVMIGVSYPGLFIRLKIPNSVPLLRRSSVGRNLLPGHCLFQAVAHVYE